MKPVKISEEPDFTASLSPGERLKAKRTELGISLKQVSNALLISVSNLKALEDNRYGELPGLTYIVGYWRSYANILDIDISGEIEIHKKRLQSSDALASYYLGQQADVQQKKSRKGSIILFVLLFAGFLGGLWFWQKPVDTRTVPLSENNAADDVARSPVLLLPESGESDLLVDVQESAKPAADADVTTQSEPAVSEEPEVSGEPEPEPAVSEEPESVELERSDLPVVAQELVVTDVIVDLQESEQGADPGTESDSGSIGEIFGPDNGYDASSLEWLKVDVYKTVWIDIRNGQGEKLVFRMVNEGENLEINGSPPFYVFIGSLNGVEVYYLGESVDIPPHSSGLSSRFVVGEYPEAASN